jgi:hypothetical protein
LTNSKIWQTQAIIFAYSDFAELFFKHFFYTRKHTFGGGTAPLTQNVGYLLGWQSQPEK